MHRPREYFKQLRIFLFTIRLITWERLKLANFRLPLRAIDLHLLLLLLVRLEDPHDLLQISIVFNSLVAATEHHLSFFQANYSVHNVKEVYCMGHQYPCLVF